MELSCTLLLNNNFWSICQRTFLYSFITHVNQTYKEVELKESNLSPKGFPKTQEFQKNSFYNLFEIKKVENVGVEPTTSWMQIKRSSQLS